VSNVLAIHHVASVISRCRCFYVVATEVYRTSGISPNGIETI